MKREIKIEGQRREKERVKETKVNQSKRVESDNTRHVGYI